MATDPGTLFETVEPLPDQRPVQSASEFDLPGPVPTSGEVYAANREIARTDRSDFEGRMLADGYAPILDALGLDRRDNPGFFPKGGDRDPIGNIGPFGGAPSSLLRKQGKSWWSSYIRQDEQERLIAAEIRSRRQKDPNFLKGVPDSREGIRAWILDDFKKKRASAQNVASRAEGIGSALAGFGGQMVELGTDLPNLVTLPIGGGGGKLSQIVLRESLVNAGLEALQQPMVAVNREKIGEHLSLGEAASNIATTGVAGGVLEGGVHLGIRGVKATGPLYDKLVGRVFEAMPESVQQRWARRMTAGGVKLEDLFADVDNRELGAFARNSISEDRFTPDERASVQMLEREQETGEASPFERGPDGDAAHAQSLEEALNGIIAETPSRKVRPSSEPAMPRPSASMPDFERQWTAIIGNEGGTDKQGRFLTSRAGAIGPAQVMPGTAPYAAKLAGLPFDDHRYRTDPAYNAALGRAYYQQMLREFGDPTKAAAAYNAGPGSATRGTGLRGAIARAVRAGEPDNWERYLPAETQQYVKDFRRRSGATGETVAPVQRTEDTEIITDEEPAVRDEAVIEPVPVLKREIFADDAEWAEAQTALYHSLNDGAPEGAEIGFAPTVYHGTNRQFDQFELRPSFRQDSYGKFEVQPQAFFFSESAETARMFAEDRALVDERLRGQDRGNPHVTAHRLRVEQPFDMVIETPEELNYLRENGFPGAHIGDPNPELAAELMWRTGSEPETWDDVQTMLDDPEVVKSLRDDGYDAVRLREADGSISWAVFDPEKIGGASGGWDGSPDRGAEGNINDEGALNNAALKNFDDPAGEGPGTAADSIEHDLLADIEADPLIAAKSFSVEGVERPLADILADLNNERAAVAAIRGCL